MILRPVKNSDDAAVGQLIRDVMTEMGASGPGFAIHDPEVSAMSTAYAAPDRAYFVIEDEGQIVGGGGVAPLEGGPADTCELRKMYFRPQARGRGWGRRMLETCLAAAKERGFRHCYLETLGSMTDARRLYEAAGFEKIAAPLGGTGHFGCDAWYVKPLA